MNLLLLIVLCAVLWSLESRGHRRRVGPNLGLTVVVLLTNLALSFAAAWTSAMSFRQHPGESVWRVVWQLPAIAMFGLPLWIVALYLTISAANAQFEHANIRRSERLDRWLRLLFVTPNMHKVHHSRLQPETDSNYANIFSVWDRAFGTYTSRIDFRALRYGLDDLHDHDTFVALLRMPF